MAVEDAACVQETVKEEFSRDTEGWWGGEEMRGVGRGEDFDGERGMGGEVVEEVVVV